MHGPVAQVGSGGGADDSGSISARSLPFGGVGERSRYPHQAVGVVNKHVPTPLRCRRGGKTDGTDSAPW
eukprot:3107164-Prymnesium_polylepis.1